MYDGQPGMTGRTILFYCRENIESSSIDFDSELFACEKFGKVLIDFFPNFSHAKSSEFCWADRVVGRFVDLGSIWADSSLCTSIRGDVLLKPRSVARAFAVAVGPFPP